MFSKNLKYLILLLAGFFCLSSCEDDRTLPVLDLSGNTNFAPAVLISSATGNLGTLNADVFEDVVATFEWQSADFGVQAPLSYDLEMALENTFTTVEKLGTTSKTKLEIKGETLNNALLKLGAVSEAETTAFFRIVAKVVGAAQVNPVTSAMFERTVTPVQLSDCGNWCTLAIIGSATPGGWDKDTDMQTDGADLNTWTITIYLTGTNEVKFRVEDKWDNNWGGPGLSGTAVQNGTNIAIPTSGWYKVTFNDATLAYSIEALTVPTFSTVGIIGDATPGGWGADTDLAELSTPGGNLWLASSAITLTAAETKFRANDDWADNWGDDQATFPSGKGGKGQGNIPVQAGSYFPMINTVTNEYWYLSDNTDYASIGVVGAFTNWGGDPDKVLVKSAANPYIFSGIVTLPTDSELKFRANSDWANNWGNAAFPAGVGNKGGNNVVAKAGTYFVIFNSGTGEYKFIK
ncbi:MAG: SusF/SusE family outer membrane protein [Microscillaceae bacterium]|nr:SusF/SusE family outer membrane protein [Microscillaceae bacterium]